MLHTKSRYYIENPLDITPAERLISGYLTHRLEHTPTGSLPRLWPKDWQNLATLLNVSVDSVKRYRRRVCEKLGITTRSRGNMLLITSWPTETQPTGKHVVITEADTKAAGYNVTRALVLTTARLSRENDTHPASIAKLSQRTGTGVRTVKAALSAAGVLSEHTAKPSAHVSKAHAKPSAHNRSLKSFIRSKKNERAAHEVIERKVEKKKPSQINQPLPEDWLPSSDSVQKLTNQGLTPEQITASLRTFRQHWLADAGSRSSKQWESLFIGWTQQRQHWQQLQANRNRVRTRTAHTTQARTTDLRSISTEQALADRSWAC